MLTGGGRSVSGWSGNKPSSGMALLMSSTSFSCRSGLLNSPISERTASKLVWLYGDGSKRRHAGHGCSSQSDLRFAQPNFKTRL